MPIGDWKWHIDDQGVNVTVQGIFNISRFDSKMKTIILKSYLHAFIISKSSHFQKPLHLRYMDILKLYL